MNIVIYSTSICASCVTLENWLDKQAIAYEKKITDTDPAIMTEFMEVNDGMIGVPFTVVTDDDGTETKISGFDPSEFKQVLHIA